MDFHVIKQAPVKDAEGRQHKADLQQSAEGGADCSQHHSNLDATDYLCRTTDLFQVQHSYIEIYE